MPDSKDEVTKQTWNKVAQLYDQQFMSMDCYNESYDYLCSQISTPAPAILDVGCGPGNISRYIAQQIPDAQIHGIDYADEMIALAAKNIPSGKFEVKDIRTIDTLTDEYHAIVAGFCIPYLSVSECEAFFMHSKKNMIHHGLGYISFVEGDASQSGWLTGSTGNSTYFYYHQKVTLTNMLTHQGFTILKQYDIPYGRNNGDSEMHTALIYQL